MTADYQAIIDKYYPSDNELRTIYMRHARQVTALALAINISTVSRTWSGLAMHDLHLTLDRRFYREPSRLGILSAQDEQLKPLGQILECLEG